MKVLILVCSLFFSFAGSAQMWTGQCLTGLSQVWEFGSFNFEADTASNAILIIDTSFTGNIWQVGAVQKQGFDTAHSGTNALQTDTVNNYPVGNESAAIVYFDSSFASMTDNITSLSFWHFYDSDTLNDSCIIQMTLDSGKTWLPVNSSGSTPSWWWIVYEGSLNDYGNSFHSGNIWWSGRSSGWKQEAFCLVFPGIKGMPIPRTYGFRFLFHADSVETNKPGWMIDNIQFMGHFSTPGIKDAPSAASLRLYPNPNRLGIFTVDYPSSYVTGSVDIFNSLGQRVQSQKLSKTIDLSNLPPGIYHYSISFTETQQRFTGKLQLH